MIQWTYKIPKVAGRYWWQLNAEHEPQIVDFRQVLMGQRAIWKWMDQAGNDHKKAPQNWQGRWWGPIGDLDGDATTPDANAEWLGWRSF